MNYFLFAFLFVFCLLILSSIFFLGVLSYLVKHRFFFDDEIKRIKAKYSGALILNTIKYYAFAFGFLICCCYVVISIKLVFLFPEYKWVICVACVGASSLTGYYLTMFLRDELFSYFALKEMNIAFHIATSNGFDPDKLAKMVNREQGFTIDSYQEFFESLDFGK